MLGNRKRMRTFIQRARGAVRANPGLSAEYDRVQAATRSSRRQITAVAIGAALGAGLALVIPGFLLAVNFDPVKYQQFGVKCTLAVVTALETVVACLVAGAICGHLRSGVWLTVLSAMPIADRKLVWRAWTIAASASATFGMYVALYGFCFIAWAQNFGLPGWSVAVGLALGETVVAAGLGTLLAVYWPSFPFCAVGLYGFLGIGLYSVAGAPGWPYISDVLAGICPAGWIGVAFGEGFVRGNTLYWWALLPAAIVVAGGGVALRNLLNTYRIREFTFRSGMFVLADTELWDARSRSLDFRLLRILTVMQVDAPIVTSRCDRSDTVAGRRHVTAKLVERWFEYFRNMDERPAGFLERFQRQFLTQHEADLLAYLMADNQTWYRIYPRVLAINTCALAVQWILDLKPGDPAAIFPALATIISLTPLFLGGGRWFGLSAPQFAGTCIPRFSLLPIGFDEISRLMFKIGCVRGLLLLPVSLLFGLMFSLAIGATDPWYLCALGVFGFGVGIVLLCLIGQGWAIGVRFAETMTFPEARPGNLFWRIMRVATSALGIIPLVLLTNVTMLVSGILLEEAGILTDDSVLPYFLLPFFILFVAWSISAWFCVRVMYRRGHVDLVRTRLSAGQAWLQLGEQGWNSSRES